MAIYRMTVGGKEYQVEIEDVNTQPVRTVVNGHVVHVWTPEQDRTLSALPMPVPVVVPSASITASPTATAAQPGEASELEVRAPMPGTIVAVEVRVGEQVRAGQNLCVLDAMKMHNLIRAPHAGVIAHVHVGPGQQVQYGDVLMTFADQE
jgi:biotin carboxyl carrier protein